MLRIKFAELVPFTTHGTSSVDSLCLCGCFHVLCFASVLCMVVLCFSFVFFIVLLRSYRSAFVAGLHSPSKPPNGKTKQHEKERTLV